MAYDDYVSKGRHTQRLRATPIGSETPCKRKPTKVIDEENLETCLNCDAPKCRGSCEKIRRQNDGTKNP